jgi:hypothetical protein
VGTGREGREERAEISARELHVTHDHSSPPPPPPSRRISETGTVQYCSLAALKGVIGLRGPGSGYTGVWHGLN